MGRVNEAMIEAEERSSVLKSQQEQAGDTLVASLWVTMDLLTKLLAQDGLTETVYMDAVDAQKYLSHLIGGLS